MKSKSKLSSWATSQDDQKGNIRYQRNRARCCVAARPFARVIFEPGERYRLRNLSKHQLVKGTIHPYRGEWLEFDVEHKPGKDVTAGTRVARKRRMGIFTLLRALGYDEEGAPGFLDRFVAYFDFLEGQWEKERHISPTKDEAILEIYKRARPGEPATPESARAFFEGAFSKTVAIH